MEYKVDFNIHTETDPNKLFVLGDCTFGYTVLEDSLFDTKRIDGILSELRNNYVEAEESALKEYFLEVHGIDVSDLITLSKSVNNLKFKHFEKRICLNTHKYYFKNELFMVIDYIQDGYFIQKLWK